VDVGVFEMFFFSQKRCPGMYHGVRLFNKMLIKRKQKKVYW